jgi:hypothetical protein
MDLEELLMCLEINSEPEAAAPVPVDSTLLTTKPSKQLSPR